LRFFITYAISVFYRLLFAGAFHHFALQNDLITNYNLCRLLLQAHFIILFCKMHLITNYENRELSLYLYRLLLQAHFIILLCKMH